MLSTTFCARRATRFGLTLALFVGVPQVMAAQTTVCSIRADEDTVRALERSRGEALLQADVTSLGRMVADEFVEISRFGQVRTKADNLRDISSGDLKLLTVQYNDLTVHVYGDVAILTGI